MSRLIPTLGCIIAYPSITMFFSLSITGLFSMWAIAPTSSNAEFSTRSVSASSVIIYFIVFSFSVGIDCIVFVLNGFFSCKMNSLN